jgi:hypothetical protein
MPASRHNNHEAKRARMAEFLAQLARGSTITESSRQVGVTAATYRRWRKEHPEFARKADEVRARFRAANVPGAEDDFDGTFASFRKTFFRMDTYDHQRELVEILQAARPMTVTLVTFPPEHGKTSTLEDFVGYKLALDPDYRFGFVSEREHHGKKIIGRVKHRMTHPDFVEYQARFGPFEPSPDSDLPWTATHFTVAQRTSDERDFSLVATGWKSAVAGSRYDMLLVDDVQSRKSLNATTEIVETLQQDHFSRVGKQGAIVIVATRVGESDVYDALIRQGVIDSHVTFPAVKAAADPGCERCAGEGRILDPEAPFDEGWTCDCRALCPPMWPGASLDKRRKQVTEPVWFATYQQAPTSSHVRTFTSEMWDDCTHPSIPVGTTSVPGDIFPRQVSLAVDPALDGGNAIQVVAASTENLLLVDATWENRLGQVEKILSRIEDMAMRYRPAEVIIEQMAFQKALANDERLATMAKRLGFRVLPHTTRANKTDPIMGVASMDRSFLRGEIIIPGEGQVARFDHLREQLLAWKSGVPTRTLTQDSVMALWFAWLRWMQTRAAALHRASGENLRVHSGVPGGMTTVPRGRIVARSRVGVRP